MRVDPLPPVPSHVASTNQCYPVEGQVTHAASKFPHPAFLVETGLEPPVVRNHESRLLTQHVRLDWKGTIGPKRLVGYRLMRALPKSAYEPRTVPPYRFRRNRPRDICGSCGHSGQRHKMMFHSEDRSVCSVHCKECRSDCYAFGCHGRRRVGLSVESAPSRVRLKQLSLSSFNRPRSRR